MDLPRKIPGQQCTQHGGALKIRLITQSCNRLS